MMGCQHLLVILSYWLLQTNYVVKADVAQVCSMLYKEANNTGIKFPMLDGTHVTNFEEEYITVDTAWNHTTSFYLEPGCVLKVCNDTNFVGQCESYRNSQNQPPEGMQHFLSASCECHKNCTCSDIKMRRSSCARLYFAGCDICNPQYIDFVDSRKTFVNEFSSNKQTIKVRSGCNLTIYPEEDHEGDEVVVDSSEDHWNYEGVIGSYTCQCDNSQYIPHPKPSRPPSYPKMIDIPNSIEGVSRMIQGEDGRHPGLLAAMSSLKNRRSSKNAYIITVGSTGSGKSSAINLLFDNPNVTKVGGAISTTSDIHEFRIRVPIDELGIQNSELRVIDTPGLLDTRGLEQDAKFLATLDDYLSNHEELHNKIPNVVFIFHKFTDNRFSGVGSSFVKMLRGIDSFKNRITDSTYSNVVFVLSHFCSETPDIKKRPKERLKEFKTVIQEYSLYPKPIVIAVAENKGGDHNLPMVNGYYKLPNGDFYPRNLFDKIQKLTESSGDLIGDAVIRTAFRNSDDFNISSTTYNLVGQGNKKIPHYYNILINAILDVENTEISQLLEKSHQTMDSDLKQKYKDSLPYLQKSLNIRNLRTRADIPQTTLGVLELITSLRQNEAILYLLEDALQITPPVFPTNVIAGYNFHVFKDQPLARTPFDLGAFITSDIGYLFPSVLSCSVEKKAVDFIQFHATREEYIQTRMKKLGIEGEIAADRFTGEIKPGFNIKSESFSASSCTITAVREIRTFELILNDKPVLSDSFKKVLLQLPVYNETEHENVLLWNNFFENYGTHVVKSVYGGGAIEITLRSAKKCDTDSITKALFQVIQFAEDLVSFKGGNSSAITAQDGITHQLKFKGGDQKYHTTDLTKMTLDDASALLNKWKDSLQLNPTVLTTEMGLIPIGEIARKVGQKQNITTEIKRATSLYFNSKLIYNPKPTIEQVNGDRDTVAPVHSMGGFTQLIQMMMNQTAESNKRFELMVERMDADRRASDLRRDNERAEQRAWERKQEEIRMNITLADKKARHDQEIIRQAELKEYMAAQAESERRYREDEARRQAAIQSAHEANAQRQYDLMIAMANRPDPPTSSCLKQGTLIHMADGGMKPVELLTVGDSVLDHNLNPTMVVGVSYEFLMSQSFYGFDNKTFFFTDSHILAGPSQEQGTSGGLQFYVKDMPRFLGQNPLMEYIDAEEMQFGKPFQVSKLDTKTNAIVGEMVQVYKDPAPHREEELIYFFQVDSPSGTYLANGYTCRHEIPPMGNWPNTMAVLFKVFDTEEMHFFNSVPYTMENVDKIDFITMEVHDRVESVVIDRSMLGSNTLNNEDKTAIQFDQGDAETVLGGVFNNPTLGAMATKIYGATAKKLSSYLDDPDSEHFVGDVDIGRVQNLMFKEIFQQFMISIKKQFGKF